MEEIWLISEYPRSEKLVSFLEIPEKQVKRRFRVGMRGILCGRRWVFDYWSLSSFKIGSFFGICNQIAVWVYGLARRLRFVSSLLSREIHALSIGLANFSFTYHFATNMCWEKSEEWKKEKTFTRFLKIWRKERKNWRSRI